MNKRDTLLEMVENFERQLHHAQEQLQNMRALIKGTAPAGSTSALSKTSNCYYTGYMDVDKIKLIKTVREISGMGLREAKEWVENTRRTIDFLKDFNVVYTKDIEGTVKRLREGGAEIEVSYPS